MPWGMYTVFSSLAIGTVARSTPECTEPIKAALEQEDLRTSSFHEHVRVGTLALTEVEGFGDPDVLFFNVNAPDDVAKAEQLWKDQSD